MVAVFLIRGAQKASWIQATPSRWNISHKACNVKASRGETGPTSRYNVMMGRAVFAFLLSFSKLWRYRSWVVHTLIQGYCFWQQMLRRKFTQLDDCAVNLFECCRVTDDFSLSWWDVWRECVCVFVLFCLLHLVHGNRSLVFTLLYVM